MKKNNYAIGVERLVNPIDVGTLHFMQNLTGSLPKKIQEKMVAASGKKTPYMGFVVEPYSYYLGYEIKDLDWANKLLPDGFRMTKSKMYEDDKEKYYGIFGIFNAHTSGFFGLRVEFYLIAENIETGMMSWIIVDYDTNTISYDPQKGLASSNSDDGVFTIDYNGMIHLDMENRYNQRKLVMRSNIKTAQYVKLYDRLWIEGNLSIGYGREKSMNKPNVFGLVFDKDEFKEALLVKKENLIIEENTWYPGLFKEEPAVAMCFPYAQHFLSDSPGSHSNIKNEQELQDTKESIDFSKIEVMTTKPLKKMLFLGSVVSLLINLTLLSIIIF